MNNVRFVTVALLLLGSLAVAAGPAGADERVFDKKSPSNPNDIVYGGRGVSDRSAVAGVVSLILPGIGQAINKNEGKKVATHLIVGLIGFTGFINPLGFIFAVFHLWSGWDALIDRRGGYLNGCVDVPPPDRGAEAAAAA